MKPLVLDDLTTAARAALAFRRAERPALINRLLSETNQAHEYRCAFGKAHWAWGDGTLKARALQERPVKEPRLDNLEYLEALGLVIDAVIGFQPRALEAQRRTVGCGSSRAATVSLPQSQH